MRNAALFRTHIYIYIYLIHVGKFKSVNKIVDTATMINVKMLKLPVDINVIKIELITKMFINSKYSLF